MAASLPPCPRCGASHVVRNGQTRAGSVNLLCRGCGRAFVPDPKRPPITPDREALVRRLVLERLSLRAVARAAGVSRACPAGTGRWRPAGGTTGTPPRPGRRPAG